MDDSNHMIQNLQEEVESLLEQGQEDQALEAVDQAMERTDDAHTIAAILEIRGTVHYTADNLEAARDDFYQALEYLSHGEEDYELVGQIHSSLGATYHALEQFADAAQNWQLAIRHFENCDPPLLIDVATIANNLVFLYKSSGDLDSAENCFLRALQVLHAELGLYDEQTATVYCNLGSLYHQAGFHDQSHEMHEIALKTRSKMLGRAHPDTAQSLNNMALSLAASGDHESAKEHFESALKSFGSLGPEYAEDFDAVRDNYSSFLRDIGEAARADEIAARNPQD